jgi:hypothetical protein
MTRLRASEVASYVFCARAWGYDRQGAVRQNAADLEVGAAWHRRHGRQVLAAGCLRGLGYGLILLSLVGTAAYLTSRALG